MLVCFILGVILFALRPVLGQLVSALKHAMRQPRLITERVTIAARFAEAVKRFLRYPLTFLILLAAVINIPEVTNAAGKILVVQSVTIPLYDEIISGFRTACR